MATPKKLFFDTETYSETPISHGGYRYTEDCELMIATYALDGGPVKIWDATKSPLVPNELHDALEDNRILKVAHNSPFDRQVAKNAMGYDIAIELWRCTMMRAMCHGLPGSLDKLSDIFKLGDAAKHKSGKALIHLFCKPNKGVRNTSATHPEQWATFCDYAKGDIDALRALDKILPKWNLTQEYLSYWFLDQRSNDRGVAIDVELAEAALRAVNKEQASLKERTQTLTEYDGEGEGLESTSKRDKMLEYMLEAYGVSLPDLQMATIERRLQDPDLPIELKELLAMRLQVSTTSTSKYKAMLRAKNSDGRVRGMIQFSGAIRTGRDAGRVIQPQNFPSRGLMPQKDIELGIRLLKQDAADMVYDNVMHLTSSCLRPALVAAPGMKLVAADLSNIEGRYLAWIAGEEWKLQAFRDFDTITGYDDEGEAIRKGPDLYKLAYAKSFNIHHSEVDKAGRSIGKVMELACLAEDTLVLTDNGVKRIVEVLDVDRVWDGETWVNHMGLVARGAKKVVRVAGIRLTAEHLIQTGKTWTQAHLLGSNKKYLHQALETGLENLPWSGIPTGTLEVLRVYMCSARAGLSHILQRSITFLKGQVLGVIPALKNKRGIGVRTGTATPTSYLMPATDAGYVIEYQPVLTGVQTQTIRAIKITEGGVLPCTNHGLRIEAYTYRILLRWKDGISQVSNLIGLMLTQGTRRGICDLLLGKKIAKTNEKFRTCREKSTHLENVYDIAHAGPNNRFTILSAKGPLLVHNCGFAGGVGAYLTFAAAYSLDLDEMASVAYDTLPTETREEAEGFYEWSIEKKRNTFGLSKEAFVVCDSFKRLWREAHPNIVNLWGGLEEIFRSAAESTGREYTYGKFSAIREGQWLRLTMPSGRALCFPYPRVDDGGKLSFMGINQYSRRWERITTFGGKLAENVTQAGANDVFRHGAKLSDAHGYPLVFPVHDELVCEVPDSAEYSAEGLSKYMATVPAWAKGLPLAAEGFEAYRYRK